MKKNTEIPGIITNGGILFVKSGIDFNFYWKFVSKYESSRFVQQIQGEPTIFAPLGDYLTMDISTGYTFGSNVLARIFLRIQNLTDKRYSTVAGYPDFGRRFNIGLRTDF